MFAFDGTERPAQQEFVVIARGGFAEFIAMMMFVYFGCGAASSNLTKAGGEWDPAATSVVALQFGFGITVLAFATAHSSGGHINCAVTWCLTLAGKCHPLTAVAYLICQIAGSISGALLLSATTKGSDPALDRTGGVGANGFQNDTVTAGNAFLGEFMGTFLLCFVVLESAVNTQAVTMEGERGIRGNKQNLAPLAIGLAVFMAHVPTPNPYPAKTAQLIARPDATS
jgi:glycerol uptake facilitator-like aquaporin